MPSSGRWQVSSKQEGIRILASTCYLEHLLFPRGVLTRKKPTAEQMEDIRFGWKMAREIGRLDIGQCVVVRDRVVMAVEAIEGTDAAIRRGGELAGSGAVVVKVKKPDQDFRFDLPATGIRTIETLAGVSGSVLAVEAGQSLVFDRKEMVAAADRAGIAVVGLVENEKGELEYSGEPGDSRANHGGNVRRWFFRRLSILSRRQQLPAAGLSARPEINRLRPINTDSDIRSG